MLVSRLTSDVQALDEFLREALVEVVGSGLQIALTVVVLVILSPTLALVSLVALPVLHRLELGLPPRRGPARTTRSATGSPRR